MPATHAAFSACCALAPSPEESTKKCELGEQSSKCQRPNPPSEPGLPSPPSPSPASPPLPTAPPLPAVPAPPPLLAPALPGAPATDTEPPLPVLPPPPTPTTGPLFGPELSVTWETPVDEMVVTPVGEPITALVSGSRYSSSVSAENWSTAAQPSAPLNSTPTRHRAGNRIPAHFLFNMIRM